MMRAALLVIVIMTAGSYGELPITPRNLTIIKSPLSPTLLVAWIIDRGSLVDQITVYAYTTGRLPNKAFLVQGDPSHLPSHYNISTKTLDQGVNYSFTVTASYRGIHGLESQRAFLTTKTICLHPEETIGNLTNQQEQMTWYFIDGRSYKVTCPEGFKPLEGGLLWECSDGKWLNGSDCVPDKSAQIFVSVGLTVGGLLIIVIIGATIMVKTSKKRGKLETDIILENETVAEKLQKDLSVSAAKMLVDGIAQNKSHSKGALKETGRTTSKAKNKTAPMQSGKSKNVKRKSTGRRSVVQTSMGLKSSGEKVKGKKM